VCRGRVYSEGFCNFPEETRRLRRILREFEYLFGEVAEAGEKNAKMNYFWKLYGVFVKILAIRRAT